MLKTYHENQQSQSHVLALRFGHETLRKMLKIDFKFRPTLPLISMNLLRDLISRFGDVPFRILIENCIREDGRHLYNVIKKQWKRCCLEIFRVSVDPSLKVK